MLAAPLAGAAVIRRRREPERSERVAVLLALDDVNALGLGQLVKAVGHDAHAVEIPEPAAPIVAPTTAEVLRLEANHFIEQHAALVGVAVLRDFAPSRRPGAVVVLGRRGQVGERHADCGGDLLGRATLRVAIQERAAVVADAHGERALVLIVVGRAEREPAPTGALDAAQSVEDRGADHAGPTASVPSAKISQRTARRCRVHSAQPQGSGRPASRLSFACSSRSATARVTGGMSSAIASEPSARMTDFMARSERVDRTRSPRRAPVPRLRAPRRARRSPSRRRNQRRAP